jgi:hypothetical protein
MTELKVDKIIPSTGSSITLGESGKTIVIPSGTNLDASAATLTNIGTNVNYCSSLKSSPFAASASRGYFINTGSAVTVTLPSSPNVGDQIIIIDATGNASSNNITLGRNSSKIKGQCKCFALDDDRIGVRIVYSGSSQGWITATSSNETAPVICGAAYVTASGGTVTTSGDYKIHTFTSSGTFTVTSAGNSIGSNKVSYMVVAGGAGGGGSCRASGGYGAGGGGAGGFREGKCTSDPYTASPLNAPDGLAVPAQAYPITIGAGGAGGVEATPGTAGQGTDGANSIFSSITSAGGGGGGAFDNSPGPVNIGRAGGSGGGAGAGGHPTGTPYAGGAGNTPPVSPPQGNPGATMPGSNQHGTGGGGATTAGSSSPGCLTNATGGTGATTSINATPTARAGGGGGHRGAGGAGGGGDGADSGTHAADNATANTGGGGGAGGYSAGHATGGVGGSGIVIIRYKYQN